MSQSETISYSIPCAIQAMDFFSYLENLLIDFLEVSWPWGSLKVWGQFFVDALWYWARFADTLLM